MGMPEARSIFLAEATRVFEIRIDSEVPSEVSDAVVPLLKKWAWIVPSFVNYVFLRWAPTGEDGAAASATVMEDYRRMTLWIHGSWLSNTERGRESDIRHELLHAITEPIYRFAREMGQLAGLEGKAADMAKEQLRMAIEKVTCDLENMLDRHAMFGTE